MSETCGNVDWDDSYKDFRSFAVFDRTAFAEYLIDYKRDFVEVTWPDEKYKWQAVQHFQDHWDVTAENFAVMLDHALAKTGNLLASAARFPRRMIKLGAEADPDQVRAMFVDLFDETKDLFERVDAFKQASGELFDLNGGRSHFQDENSISTYLWLRYPDKYYIYKWSLARANAEALGADYTFKMGDVANNVRNHFVFYNEISDALQQDDDLRELLESQLTPDCYTDPQLKTMTIDFGYFINAKAKQLAAAEQWWPSKEEYDPGLSVDDWQELLDNSNVFDASSLRVLACFKDIGGTASCSAVAAKYGRKAHSYNLIATKAAARVLKASAAASPPDRGEENERRWPVLFTGRPATKDELGTYVWRLRDELSEALDRIDLDGIKLYETDGQEISDGSEAGDAENHWLLVASPKQFSFSDLPVGGVERWTLYTENGTKRRIFRNFESVRAGDLVIGYESTPVKQIVALGEFIDSSDGETVPFEKTEGLVSPIDYQEMKELPEGAEMEGLPNIQGSLFKLTKTQYDALMDLVRDSNPAPKREEFPRYSKDDFLRDVFTTNEHYEGLVGVLRRKKNIILQGAPGVGKTYAANRLAWSMTGEKDPSRVEFVQFHQNYSYEDFMLGYKPVDDGFKLQEGTFFKFCKRAANRPDQEFFFIIDEINRGNMSKIFGELLMLIENDYRGTKATLAYGGLSFSVPKNVHIIGMMNTADRSLAMIDYALRRRFSFVEMKPGFQSEGFKRYQADLGDDRFDSLLVLVQALNEQIAKDPSLGRGFCIGHSYFCGQESIDEEWLRSVIDYDILPMLEEYWFDDEAKVTNWRAQLHGILQP